ARVEEFDGEQPLQREGFGDATRDALGLLADAIRKGSRQLAVHQDSRRVVVEGGGIDRDLPPGAARDRPAQPEREVQLRFGDAGGLPQSAEDLRCIFGSLEDRKSVVWAA